MTPPRDKDSQISILYTLSGDPSALSRVQFGQGRSPEEHKHIKMITRISLTSQHNDAPFLIGPLHLHAVFILPLSARKNTKPEISNLIKFIEDICSGIVYQNNCVIHSICSEKRYGINPRTEFTLEGINEKNYKEQKT